MTARRRSARSLLSRVAILAAAIATMLPWSTAHAASAGRAAAPVPVWSLDPSHTTIAFSIDATGFPRTEGVFRQFNGKVGIDFDRPARSQVGFRVQSGSVDVGSDLLAELLRGRLFLDTERFAEIGFVSRAVEKLDDRTVRGTGDLSLIGATLPLTVDVEVRRLAPTPHVRLGLTAKAHIDRLAFGMREGYPMISRTVDLVVTSEAVQR